MLFKLYVTNLLKKNGTCKKNRIIVPRKINLN